MNHEWLLPSNTRIVGQGAGTTLQPQTSQWNGYADNSNAIIEMGATAGSTGVVIEHLGLDGTELVENQSLGLSGIYNANAQDASYVDDVVLYHIGSASGQTSTATGLFVGPNAKNSGPYSNINFEANTYCTANTGNCTSTNPCTCVPTACVKIQAPTRGLHGITCTARSVGSFVPAPPAAAIYLDANDNTIEDVHVEGFYDAVVVGDNADGENGTVAANTLANVVGGYGRGQYGIPSIYATPNFLLFRGVVLPVLPHTFAPLC